jgi:DNA-binding beta-propeller fold protein YncE
LKVFDAEGKFIRRFGSQGVRASQLSYPWGIGTDSEGNIIVSEHSNARISIFDQNGTYLRMIGMGQV